MDSLNTQSVTGSRNSQGSLQLQTQQSTILDNASTSTQIPMFRHLPTVANGGGAVTLARAKVYLVTDLLHTAIKSFCGARSLRMIQVIQIISTWVQGMKQAPSQEELVRKPRTNIL